MKIIDATHYIAAHVRAPRGRGNWAFEVMRSGEVMNVYFAGRLLTYASASRKAVEWFRSEYQGDPRYSLRVAS